MIKKFERGIAIAFGIFSAMMAFIPDEIFSNIHIVNEESVKNRSLVSWADPAGVNITVIKILIFIALFIICFGGSCLFAWIRRVKINGDNYSIVVEYGDLLKKKNCQRVINFDECYTTTVGTRTADVKKETVCGQYLLQNPNLDIQKLIAQSGVKPCKKKSEYKDSICYQPGTIVPNGDDLLMAFTKLESNGKSKKFTVEEYLNCLNLLWEEIDNNYNNKDVCIPVLGSGVQRFENGISQSLLQQELVDLIISSYKLSPYKIKDKNTLHIVCRRRNDFSMDKVG